MRTISEHIARLILCLRERPATTRIDDAAGPRLATNAITKRAGSLYEKLRYTLEYKDENAIRRSAIERILKRLYLFERHEALGRTLLMELIRAGYIENDRMPESVCGQVQQILNGYLTLKRTVRAKEDLVLAHAATEVERFLFPSPYREAVFEAMHRSVQDTFAPREGEVIDDETFRFYVYIACRGTFLRDSAQEIQYALWRRLEPSWDSVAVDPKALPEIADRFPAHAARIDALIRSDVPARIQSRLQNESIYAALLMELVQKYGEDAQQILGDEEALAAHVRAHLQAVYRIHEEKITRSGKRAILYVLLTKIAVGLMIEIPYEVYHLGQINYLSLGINTLFFPALLFGMVKSVRYPDQRNTEALVRGMERFITGEEKTVHAIRTASHRGSTLLGVSFLYIVLCLITFGAILSTLLFLGFNAVSIALFLFFLMIVSYFGLRIRYRSRAWTYEANTDSTKGLLWYLLTLPVTRTGRWISLRLDRVNAFVFFMDFILETPLKLLLASFDDFVSFAKEMRRDLR